jgi:hypothetical protein
MNIPKFTAGSSLFKSAELNRVDTVGNLPPRVSSRNAVQPAINCRACIEAGGECLCGGRGCFCV